MTATFPEVTVNAPTETTARPASRWLHVVSHTDPRYGGLSSAVPALAASVAAYQASEPALAAFCRPGEAMTPVAVNDENIRFWPTSRLAWWRDKGLKAQFAEAVRGVDGVHVHGLWEQSTAMACKIARQVGTPYVLSAHGMLEPWALATKKLKKSMYAALIERANVTGAACLHALTTAEAEQYRRFGATCPIAVIPNAVSLPEDIGPDAFEERFPQLRGGRNMLFMSRLHPKKGLDLLIAAWARCSEGAPDAHLVIAGPDDGGMQAILAEQAARAGVADRVTFTGMLTGTVKWSALAAASCYVLPSHSEGLSMALLEAMGMGLPVIATRACNMPEITTAGAGWEIEASVDSIASALGDFLSSSIEENRRKARNGARLIAERYTFAEVARQMAEVYDFVLGGAVPQTVMLQKGDPR